MHTSLLISEPILKLKYETIFNFIKFDKKLKFSIGQIHQVHLYGVNYLLLKRAYVCLGLFSIQRPLLLWKFWIFFWILTKFNDLNGYKCDEGINKNKFGLHYQPTSNDQLASNGQLAFSFESLSARLSTLDEKAFFFLCFMSGNMSPTVETFLQCKGHTWLSLCLKPLIFGLPSSWDFSFHYEISYVY